jgi:hypothetical protein
MKSRIQRLEIRNFKAFREFTLDLEGRHLLVYGPPTPSGMCPACEAK